MVFQAFGDRIRKLVVATGRTARIVFAARAEHHMLEFVADPAGSVDMYGAFRNVNAAFASMVGYTKRELLQMTYRDITPERWRETEDAAITRQVLVRGYSDLYRKEYRRKDGTIVSVELRTALLRDLAGRPSGLWFVARDITERVAAEQQLRASQTLLAAVIDQSPTPTWISDREGTLIKINKACRDLLHITEEEVLGRYNVLRDDVVEEQGLTSLIRRVYEEHVPVRFKIIWDAARLTSLELKDHAAVVLHTSIFPILDASGTLTNAVIQHLDVTGLTKMEEEKARLEAELFQAQKMESVGRLAGGVAHDFNNMLGVILGYADLIKGRLTPGDPMRAEIEEIERAARRSTDVVRQLLAFSRKQVIEPRITDLNAAVSQMRPTLARVIGEDVELRVDEEPELWKVRMDSGQLNQILMNMAANARDAMPHGGRLEIRTANVVLDEAQSRKRGDCAPGRYVSLSIRDNGIGMDKETLSHLFEPFFTTKEMGRGTGLGLATVYGIVKQSAGCIEVNSAQAHGTTFRVLFPAAGETGEQPEGRETPEATDLPIEARVLVVEDDSMVHQIAASLLKAIGCTVFPAESAENAVEIFRRMSADLDLVISDVIMPGMTGAQLRDAIRQIRADIPVLFMSGYAAEVIARRGILEPGVHLIQKPFGRSELSRKIREALGRA